MTTPTPRTDALIRFEFGPTGQPFPAHALLAMIQLAKELERDLAAAQEARQRAEERAAQNEADARRLDWAESHPLDAYAKIVAQWADCGRGGRECFFNFRHAIDSARAK